MAYKKNVWKSKDRITKEKLNNIEEGIYEAHRIIATIINGTSYTITRNLSNCTSSNTSSSVNQGASYSATITPNSGYTLSSITVTMNGTDITDTAVNIKTDTSNTAVSGETLSISGKTLSVSGETLLISGTSSNATRYAVVNISNVTGNIVISATAVEKTSGGEEETTYTITRNLSNCTSNNTTSSVNQGSSYSATITPNSGYELLNVAITMGGTNVTSTVYTYQNGNAVINIPNVTGNVVITIQATASSSSGGGDTGGGSNPGGSGSNPVSGNVLSYMTYGKGISQTTAEIRDNPECWATVEPVTIKNGTTYTISVDGTYLWVLAIDDSGNAIVPFLTTGTNSKPQSFTFTATTSKIKFGCYDPNHTVTYCTLTEGSSSGSTTTTYTVTKNLPNCTSSNTASSVNKNANYSTLISANDGYKIDSITVTMGGTDITSSVVTEAENEGVKITLHKISDILVRKGETFNILYSSNISAVKHEISWDGGNTFWDKTSEILVENTVNYKYSHNAETNYDSFNMAIRVTDANGNTDVKYFTITFENNVTEPGETFYTVTKNLTNCSSSNNTTSITEGASYTTNITANSGYTLGSITVTMGGTNITSSAVSGNSISISNVTGNIVINAIAVAVAESSDLLDSTGAYMVDDFTGSSVDRSKWDYELGYVRNGELQNYTSTNTEVNNSILALKGIKDSNGNWTSSSIISKGHFAFMYGKIECRAKIDPTWGSFSAFWTLGDSFEFGYHDGASPDTLGEWWAYCGEFDVMEFYSGKLTCGTFFNEREESGRVWYNNYDFNAWHTFAMEWLEDGTLIFSIDGNELSRTSATTNRAFHIPHFILINQAIGASGGTPESGTTAITQYVDWVKYYPASTENVVLNSSNFNLEVTGPNDNAHNCMVRPIFYDNCINKSLTWSSSDSSLVWVHSGLCGTYAGANGTVTITATSHSGVSKSITLTVTDGTIR